MAEAGCRLLYPLCRLAVMWFLRVLAHAPTFLQLLSRADRFFRHHRPDAVVLIDFPGFNWWLARRAHFHGIPVFYFVPPQLWAWAGWRVGKMRRYVDHVLCSLPFEGDWYEARGVHAHYVGHPYFDELALQRLDPAFLTQEQGRPGTVIALLPGSRTQEVQRNWPSLMRAAAHIHQARPETRFLVACFKPSQQQFVDSCLRGQDFPIETHTGRTPEIIHLARACISVSGSVGLELLYQAKPTVVVYRVRSIDLAAYRLFKTTPYISLVNLLAGREMYPEFLTDRCQAEAIGGHVLRWVSDSAVYRTTCAELAALCRDVAQPGACERAARYVLEIVERKGPVRRRAA
jgi:lipid-A-disaccharide synthase